MLVLELPTSTSSKTSLLVEPREVVQNEGKQFGGAGPGDAFTHILQPSLAFRVVREHSRFCPHVWSRRALGRRQALTRNFGEAHHARLSISVISR